MSQTSAPSLGGIPCRNPPDFRWVICGLLFYATTVNYVDRSVFGVLAGDLGKVIGWQDWQFGLINAAFTLAYAIGFIIMGRLIDAVGTRAGYAIALTVWTLAGAGTSLARSALGFGIARFCLGIGEAGNFPAAIKTVAEWFPQRQRATATGIFNAGSNVGFILAPFLVPIVVLGYGGYVLTHHSAPAPATVSARAAAGTTAPAVDPKIKAGWPAAFLITPTLAAVWIVLWLTLYRQPEKSRFPNQAELALIRGPVSETATESNPPAAAPPRPVKWRHLLPHRQAWAFMMGKFLTDPIWWFYLLWSGKFFSDQFHAKLSGLAGPLILIYVLADVGSIAGGWFSSTLIKRGLTPNAARKTAMATCAGLILPVILVPLIPTNWIFGSGAGRLAGVNLGMWLAATLIGVAAAAHQGFSANIFTTTSDMFPKRAVSSVVGLGGLAGALSGMVMQAVAGVIKEVTKSYLIMFIIAGTVYALAVVIVHLLAPRLQPVSEEELEHKPMPLPVTGVLGAVVGFVAGLFISYLFQPHTDAAETAPVYFSSIVTGDIFKSAANSHLIQALWLTPVLSALALSLAAIGLHAAIRRPEPAA